MILRGATTAALPLNKGLYGILRAEAPFKLPAYFDQRWRDRRSGAVKVIFSLNTVLN